MLSEARSTGWYTLTNTIYGYNPGSLYVFSGHLGSGAMQFAAQSSKVNGCIVLERGDQEEFDRKMPEILTMAREQKGVLIDARQVSWQYGDSTAHNACKVAWNANVPVFVVALLPRNSNSKNVGMSLPFYYQHANAFMFFERQQLADHGVATIHVLKARHNTFFDGVNILSPNGGKTYIEWSMQGEEIVFGKEVNEYS